MAKLNDSFFGRKRWYLADDVDKVITEKDQSIKNLQSQIKKQHHELCAANTLLKEFNDKVRNKIAESTKQIHTTLMELQMHYAKNQSMKINNGD